MQWTKPSRATQICGLAVPLPQINDYTQKTCPSSKLAADKVAQDCQQRSNFVGLDLSLGQGWQITQT